MKKYISVNIFENEKYRIKKVKDNFKDRFEINEEDNILSIKRLDKNEGWGANLNLNIFDKINNKEYYKNIGSSNKNKINIQLEKIESKNHYENNFYKLYAISDYNDLFKIEYDSILKNLTVKRLDADIGWDQNLKLEYFNKIDSTIKHIIVGSSKENIKTIIIDINQIDNLKIPNIYQDSLIKIEKVINEYEDKFMIYFDHRTNIVTIKRNDTDEGWGQNIMIDVYYNNKNYTFYIGSSNQNLKHKLLDFFEFDVYVGLTTIPSRVHLLINNLQYFIKTQTNNVKKIFITIPKKYKRFNKEITIDEIEHLKSMNNIEIIYIENDLGPASKYLGPLINNKINKNDLLIIIDDDRIYNKNLIKNFIITYRSYSNYQFFSGKWSYFFDKNYKFMSRDFLELSVFKEKNEDNFKFGNGMGGFFGFALNIKDKIRFIDYNLRILELIEKSFFHDEGILLGYLKKMEETIIYLKHYGCEEYENETVDALCKSGLCNREIVEKEILYKTNYELLL